MREGAPLVFFDTVLLSNFALAQRLDLLQERYGERGFVTTEVQDEIADGISAGYSALLDIEALIAAGVLTGTTLTTPERAVFKEFLGSLATGEASCIACAKVRSGVVATDDRAARTSCSERQVPFTGTVGILKACCIDGALAPTEADIALTTMIQYGFYAPVHRISDLL